MPIYRSGDRICLIEIDGKETGLTPGDTGTVEYTDATGTIHVYWDKGGRLSIIPGRDVITRLIGVPAPDAYAFD
jgi:hypothetical protein